MNLATKKLSFVIIATAIALTGCSKKPKRPDPYATIVGPYSGTSGASVGFDGLSGASIGFDGLSGASIGLEGGTLAPGTELTSRAPGDYSNGDRATLAGNTVYFDFDQSGIKPSERTKLDAAKAYLESNPGVTLLLEGHCDWKGTAEYNLGLGDRRANAAKQYLTTSGVPAERLEVLSKGDLDAVENADADTQAKDRRVDLVLLK